MAYDYKELASRLERRFDRLETRYLSLQEDNDNLRRQLEELRANLHEQQAINSQLTQDNQKLKVANAISSSDPEQRQKAKQTIAKIIKDIDRCIENLE